MSTLTSYKQLQVVTPTPSGAGGLALNDNFTALADSIGPCNYTATTNPTTSDNQSTGYYAGSRWFNTSTNDEFVCISSTMSTAVWEKTTGGNTTPTLQQVTDAGATTTDDVTLANVTLASGKTLSVGVIAAGTITTGSWQGSIVSPTYGGTGVNNGTNSLTLAANVIHAGAFAMTFTAVSAANLTMPPTTADTLVGVAATQTLTNKTLNSNTNTLCILTGTSASIGSLVPASGQPFFVTDKSWFGVGDGTHSISVATAALSVQGVIALVGTSTVSVGNAGFVNVSGGSGAGSAGGTINVSGGTGGLAIGGSINTSGGPSNGFSGGSINTSGTSATGGNITTSGGSGSGSVGGAITTSGGSGAISVGGAINTSGGPSNGFSGGSINTSGGTTAAGGAINTSNGGGSINTTGNGSIQFGVAANLITLQGTSGAGGKTITMPAVTGNMVVDSATQTLTNKTISGASNTLSSIPATATVGTALVASNNLSDVGTPATALSNIGGIGVATTNTLTNKTLNSNTNTLCILTGTSASIGTLVPASGQPFWVTDKGWFGVGDGTHSISVATAALPIQGVIALNSGTLTAGSINSSGGAGGAGGSINTTGGSGSGTCTGGSINTSGAGSSGSGTGGNINTSATSSSGGSITTSNGGGSIDTTGNGSIQFGVTANRITLQGSASASGKTITLPAVTGTAMVGHGTGTPTLTAGSGLGTSPTLTVVGTDLGFSVTATVGTSPSSANIFTCAFNTAFASAPGAIVFSPANANAAGLSGTSQVFVSGIGTGGFTLSIGSGTLTASTAYIWNFKVESN